jgi:SAM-dependent methyltransferase
MPLRSDRDNFYLHGIRQAEQDGLIVYACNKADDRSVISDDYSHIFHGDDRPLSLKYTNTRSLPFLAKQVLNLYRNKPGVRFLELGPGAGAACAAVNRLVPDAEIDTVSLTPLNPYLRFRWDDMYRHIAEPSLHEKTLSYFYEPCTRPFVRNQYIGRFPNEISPRQRDYHFIYENHGPIFYNFDPNERGGVVTELARASISSALSLLRPDGTMVIMASDGTYRIEDALQSMTSDTDVIVTCKRTLAYHSLPCIVAKQESPLSARLRESKNGLLPKSARVLRLESGALDNVISRVCAL